MTFTLPTHITQIEKHSRLDLESLWFSNIGTIVREGQSEMIIYTFKILKVMSTSDTKVKLEINYI